MSTKRGISPMTLRARRIYSSQGGVKPTRQQVLLVLLAVAACTVGYMYLEKKCMQEDFERQGVEIDRNAACDRIFHKITNAVEVCDSAHGNSAETGLAYDKDPVSAIRDGTPALSLSVDGKMKRCPQSVRLRSALGKEGLVGSRSGILKSRGASVCTASVFGKKEVFSLA